MHRRSAPLFLLAIAAGCAPADEGSFLPHNRADALAAAVGKASGAKVWPSVKRLQFTFNVEQDGKTLITAKHDWNVVTGDDTVAWADKTLTVNVQQPPESYANDPDKKAAFQRWTNDSYWLLAPLKWLDAGVNRAYGGTKTIDGKQYEVLELSFGQVGLTNNDRFTVYIDPQLERVAYWDYSPAPDKKLTATWTGYQDFNGLTLSTDHEMAGKHIYFTDVKVER
jgi:hypothetical protein